MRCLIILAAGCGLMAQLHLPASGGHISSVDVPKSEASDTGRPETSAGSKTRSSPAPAESGADTPPASPEGYVLELRWAPESRKRLLVSGFEPEFPGGTIRESCGKPKKLPGNITKLATSYMRSAADAQHEWNIHGACSGLDPGDYFTRMIQARVAVQLPVQLTSLEGDATASADEVGSYFAGANPSFPSKAFQIRCTNGMLAGVRVCFDRDLNPQECHTEVGSCGANVRITSQSTRP